MLRTFSATLLLIAIFTSGCSTVQDMPFQKGYGVKKVYDKPYEPVWQAAKEVVQSSGLQLVSEDKTKGEIIAHGNVTAFSWGENVAVFIDSVNTDALTVEVVSKKVLAANVTAKDWAPVLFQALDDRLSRVPSTYAAQSQHSNCNDEKDCYAKWAAAQPPLNNTDDNKAPKPAPTNYQSIFESSIPICEGEKDCLAKWEAAQLWVAHNAGYKIQTATSVLIETYNATGGSTNLSAQVTKEPLGGGKYQIIAKLWCDNIFGCTPNAKSALSEFNKKVGAATP